MTKMATAAQAHLLEHGYVVLDGLITATEAAQLRASLDALMAHERTAPFDPVRLFTAPDRTFSPASRRSIRLESLPERYVFARSVV